MNVDLPFMEKSTLVLLGVLASALVGWLTSWFSRRARVRSYRRAMQHEIEMCREFARGYLDAVKEKVPLYRLPLRVYDNGLAPLLAAGALSGSQTADLIRFYNQVEQINRGLDRAAEMYDKRESEVRLPAEVDRNNLKATKLIDRFYRPAILAVKGKPKK